MNNLIMGILNVTPDSFSDGGQFMNLDSAVSHCERLMSEGADIIDVGGESTRPGATPISIQEEIDRVAPVIERISGQNVLISVDTRHFEVAQIAVGLGATIINDISGGMDIRMAKLVAEKRLTICLMHMQGTPQTMQSAPTYEKGVVQEVKEYLIDRVRAFTEMGISSENIWIDPGIGFGKTLDQNLELLRNLSEFKNVSGRILIGTSRKSFLGKILGDQEMPLSFRSEGTIASNLWAYQEGASVFRVHEVAPMKRALMTWGVIAHESSRRRAGE